MENIKTKLEGVKQALLSSGKEKLLCISTTANLNNPDIFVGSMRETETTIAGNIILRTLVSLDEIIETFDGTVDYFLVDCEVKNAVKDLEIETRSLVKKSKIFMYKPNDFTVESLDLFITLLMLSLVGKKVGIVGGGNIGSKIALKLCERGADVFLYSKDAEKTQAIVNGLNLVKRSNTSIIFAKGAQDLVGAELLLGCTPGTPGIDKNMVEVMKEGGKIIDVGNGALDSEAVAYAGETGREILVLSSLAGYKGMVENWIAQRNFFKNKRERSLGKSHLIVPGILGKRGDIIVDSVDDPKRIIGVCDGKGDIASAEDSKKFLEELPFEIRELYASI